MNYQVVDPSIEAAKARLDAMKRGRYPVPRQKKKKMETQSSLGNKSHVYVVIHIVCGRFTWK